MRTPIVAIVLAAAAAAGGCATTPLPDGSKIDRLPGNDTPLTLSPDEARALTELNAHLLKEQEAARVIEYEMWRSGAPLFWGPAWGAYPYFDAAWAWNGHNWVWRPRWGLGFGWYGGWPY